MSTPQKRTLTITCTEGNEVTKKQHSCFIHNLIADATKAKPLIHWRRSNSKDGIIYCTNGLAEGTLMTLRMLAEKPGVEFTYNHHGKLIYTAVEENGDTNCDMHLQQLLHKVTCAVTFAEAAQRRNPLAETMNSIKPKSEPKKYSLTVADMFRKVTASQIVDRICPTRVAHHCGSYLPSGGPPQTERVSSQRLRSEAGDRRAPCMRPPHALKNVGHCQCLCRTRQPILWRS